MSEFTAADFAASLAQVAETLAEHRDELCRLDGIVGDGDHGLAMADGFAAAAKAAQDAAGGTLADVANAAAKALLNAVGASSGPLYATALMRAAKAAGPRAMMPLEETPVLIAAMAEGIVARGKAEEGERTMVDAWAPAARAGSEGFAAMRAAAAAGAEATRAMVATKGRTSRLAERALGHIDPGAASAVLVIDALTRHWESL